MDNTRPTPLVDDIDGTRRKLESWIASHRGHNVTIPQLSIPEATGMSNVTLLFDVLWEENGQPRSEPVVARLQPSIERPCNKMLRRAVLSVKSQEIKEPFRLLLNG